MTPLGWALLFRALDHSDRTVRRAGEDLLRACARNSCWEGYDGEGLFELFVGLLDSDDPAVRSALVFALGRLDGERAVGVVRDRLDDPTPEVRREAITVLDRIDPADVTDYLARGLHDDDREVRSEAADALTDRRYCWDDETVVEGFVAAAKADGKAVHGVALALERTASDRTIPGLVALTAEPAASTRAKAIEKLGDVPGERITAVLVEALDDPDYQVRAKAVRGLSGRQDDRLPDLLLAGLDDPHPKVRAGAADALGRYTDSREVRDALAAVAHDETEAEYPRNEAVRAHPDLSRTDLDSPVGSVFWQAVIALVYPVMALWTVYAYWRRRDLEDGATEVAVDMFLGPEAVAYLLGHALYWVVGAVVLTRLL